MLTQAQTEAQTALTLANDTQFIESRWRANDVLAQVALAASTPAIERAEQYLQAAVAILEALRASLLAAELSDTLLENEDCLAVYARLARLLQRQGRAADLDTFLEQTGWPPLIALIAVESAFCPFPIVRSDMTPVTDDEQAVEAARSCALLPTAPEPEQKMPMRMSFNPNCKMDAAQLSC